MDVHKNLLVEKVWLALDKEVKKADVKRVLERALEEIGTAVASGNNVVFTGWGSFKSKTRAARKVPDNNGGLREIPEKRVVVFKPGRILVDRVAEVKR